MCWFGDFALEHANSIPEVQGAFIRNNPNRMKLSEQRPPGSRRAACERVRSVNRRVPMKSASRFCKKGAMSKSVNAAARSVGRESLPQVLTLGYQRNTELVHDCNLGRH